MNNEIFYNVQFEMLFLSKMFSVKEFLTSTSATQETTQNVRWPCEPIILSIRHLGRPTEVQLNSL